MNDQSQTRKASKRRRCLKRLAITLLALVLFVWLNNTSIFSAPPSGGPRILAHRGMAQTFEIEGLKWDSNTAAIIHQPRHPFLENTLPSIAAAFASGADMVEFDLRLTADQQLAVFHDALLEYRTDAKGKISDFTMAELRTLDVGHGYTADAGKTYPFRGEGKGLLVSVEDVLSAFPRSSFLIHLKSGGKTSGQRLAKILETKDPEWLETVGVYGDHSAMAEITAVLPDVKTHSRKSLKSALITYLLVGWTGYIPGEMRDTQLQIPLVYAKWLWGWPDKFLNRMSAVDTRVILVNGDGGWSEGFDSQSDLDLVPRSFNGYIWTNRVDEIASSARFAN